MLKRISFLIAVLALMASALGTRIDITGTGGSTQVASSGTARWVQFVANPGNHVNHARPVSMLWFMGGTQGGGLLCRM